MDYEQTIDKQLNIKTSGRDDSRSNQYNYPYEPTPYKVLERLVSSGYFSKENTLLDYGSGKGRVDFFMAFQTKCKCIGVEYDERMYAASLKNREKATAGGKCEFVLTNAVDFEVPETVDRMFFFNPFSVEVLQKVLTRIKESYYECPREMLMFFYYPSDEYVGKLMTDAELMFLDEVDCGDLFEGDEERERVLIFEVC